MAEHVKQAKGKQSLIQERKHGILLTIFLWFYIIANLVTVLNRLFGTGKYHHIGKFLHYPYWIDTTLYIAYHILLLIWLVAIWKWKKWGVYGLFSVSVIVSILNIYIHSVIPALVPGYASHAVYGVFILLILRVWKYFD